MLLLIDNYTFIKLRNPKPVTMKIKVIPEDYWLFIELCVNYNIKAIAQETPFEVELQSENPMAFYYLGKSYGELRKEKPEVLRNVFKKP